MTVLKKSIFLVSFLFAFALVAQANKRPVPSTTSVDRAADVIDSAITTKDTIAPVIKRDVSENTSTTTSTTTTTTTNTTQGTTSSSASTAASTTGTAPAASKQPGVQGGKNAVYVNFKHTFELLSQDELSQVDYVEYKVNDSDYVKYTNPVSLSKEGFTTIAYRAVDKVGNRESAQVLNVVVDNTPPVVTLKPVEPLFNDKNTQFASTKNTYIINAEDNAAGVKEIMYYINNEPKQAYTGQPIKIEKPGFHVINYYAVDNAGNVSPESSFLINADTVKPTVEVTESIPFVKIGDKVFARKDTTFRVSAKDGESGVNKILVKVDGATEFVPYVEDLVFNTSGEHSIEAKAIDNVGNESEVKKVTFFYDVKPPQTTIKAVSN